MSEYERILADLPDDWTIARIGDLGLVVSGGTPSREIASYWDGTIPWVTPGEVTALKQKTLRKTHESITNEGLRESGANLLPAGSLLITTRASLGYCAINSVPVTTNQGFKSIVFHKSSNSDFYYHWARKASSELKRRASGTTFLEISGSDFKQVKFPVPPSAEQQKIAKILDTLDTQIQKTEALIAKLEKIKEGLLHDLLTRGIDQNGQLRPTPEKAPELYKESALGLIPRAWQCESLRSISTGISYGFTNPMPTTSEGPWMITAADVIGGQINYARARRTRRSDYAKLSSKSKPRRGDILITKDGTLGRIAIVDTEDLCINQSVASFRPRNSKMTEYLSLYLSSPLGQAMMLADAGGSTIKHLYVSKLSNLAVPVPDVEESEKLAQALSTHQARIESERRSLSRLNLLKEGLMDDLLTGRVRVTPLLKDAE